MEQFRKIKRGATKERKVDIRYIYSVINDNSREVQRLLRRASSLLDGCQTLRHFGTCNVRCINRNSFSDPARSALNRIITLTSSWCSASDIFFSSDEFIFTCDCVFYIHSTHVGIYVNPLTIYP